MNESACALKELPEIPGIFAMEREDATVLLNATTLRKSFLMGASPHEAAYEARKLQQDRPTTPEPRMTTVKALVTTACNFRCDYCLLYKDGQTMPACHMTREVADRIVDYYNRYVGYGQMHFTGGEPLLNWDIVEYLLDRVDALFAIQTNGSLLTKEICSKLAQKNVLVLLSLDGASPKENAHRRTSSGLPTFDIVASRYFTAKEAGCKVGISVVASDTNVDKLYDVALGLKERFNPDSMGFNLLHFAKHGDMGTDIAAYTEEMKKIFLLAKSGEFYVDQIARKLKPLLLERFRLMDCAACGEQAVFLPDGSITNCVNCPPSDTPDALRRWKDNLPLHRETCHDCPAIGICGGGCPFDGSGRNDLGLDLDNCYFSKSMLPYFLWDFFNEMKAAEFDHAKALKSYEALLGMGSIAGMSAGHEVSNGITNTGGREHDVELG